MKYRLITLIFFFLSDSHLLSFTINTNGGWCWFQGHRAIITQNNLVIGSVANKNGENGVERDGNVEVTTYDLKNHISKISVLHKNLQADDHNAPALFILPNKHFLAMYTKHGSDNFIRYKTSQSSNNAQLWDDERFITCVGKTCYSNIFGSYVHDKKNIRIYNFYRGEGKKTNIVFSDDMGVSWVSGGVLLYDKTDSRTYRPYVCYAINKKNEIHFITTQCHPAESLTTKIFHGFIKANKIYTTDGSVIGSLDNGVDISSLTLVELGDENNRLWVSDIAFDVQDNPVVVFTRHKNTTENIYSYGVWDKKRWKTYDIAWAGTCLYEKEKYYTGNVCLDHENINCVYLSTNVDPNKGDALISNTDGLQHYEIFKVITEDYGKNWRCFAITQNSVCDNLRPFVPETDGSSKIVVWLSGKYTTYRSYKLQIMGQFIASSYED